MLFPLYQIPDSRMEAHGDAPRDEHHGQQGRCAMAVTFDESITARYVASHAVRQMAAIVRRDESDGIWRCRYCRVELAQLDDPRSPLDRRPHPERDHVVPRSRGGSGALANRVLACQGCNVRKGEKALSELPDGWHRWRERQGVRV